MKKEKKFWFALFVCGCLLSFVESFNSFITFKIHILLCNIQLKMKWEYKSENKFHQVG